MSLCSMEWSPTAETGSVICPLPWIQMQVTTEGDVNPCCIWTGDPAGNLKFSELDRIANSYTFKKIRRDMMHGKKPGGCNKCFLLEAVHTTSPRQYATRKYYDLMFTLTDNTSDTGLQSNIKIKAWDIRFSNLCNLRCRTCGPQASTGWYQDAKSVFGEEYLNCIQRKLSSREESQKLLNYLLEHLQDTEEIYFVGGEPLIMPEHYKVLDKILETKNDKIFVRYNTNLTTLGKDDIAIEYWKRLKEQGNYIEVGLSLDAVGAAAEYIRKGCKWSVVERNLDMILANDIHIMVMPTVSVLNCLSVIPLIDLCLGKGIKGWDVANPNIVTGPCHYDMRILPEKEKIFVIQTYQSYLEKWKGVEDEGLREKFFKPLIDFLQTELVGSDQYRRDFVRITEQLDELRKENFDNVAPEFKGWRNWC